MEGLIEMLPYWGLYSVFALIALWCWDQLFYRLNAAGHVRQVLRIIGAVLLFAPAPIASGSAYFSPAIFVIILTALDGGGLSSSNALLWLMSAFFVVLLVFTVRHGVLWLRSKSVQNNET